MLEHKLLLNNKTITHIYIMFSMYMINVMSLMYEKKLICTLTVKY